MAAVSGSVLVTGGAKRLGRAIALAFAHAGHGVVLHYNSSEDAAKETADDIKRMGGRCQIVQQDLQETAALEGMVKRAFELAPDMKMLVNSASVFEQKPYEVMGLEEYRRHMAVNLDAPVFLTQAFAQKCERGAVVNLVDSFATQDKTTFFAYLLAKKSLRDFTRMAAVALGPKVTVNAVCPGIVLPSGPGFGKEYMEKKAGTLPLKKLATVQEITDAVLLLAKSAHLTGQCLYLDGGEQLL